MASAESEPTTENDSSPQDAAVASTPKSEFSEQARSGFDISSRSSKSVILPTTSHAESEASASGNHLFSTKDNSAFKWQRARGIVGALEVVSEPLLNVRADMEKHVLKGKERTFRDALKAWEDLKLRDDFVKACEKLPAEMCCCGLMRDQESTKRRFVELLNEDWVKQANKKLLKNNRGVKLDAFLWNWQNASGKAETNIILLRFYELSSYRFRRASNDGSEEFQFLGIEDDEDEGDLAEDAKQTPDMEAPEAASMAR